jgi:Peptidase family M28
VLASAVIALTSAALAASPAASDPGHRFARSLADAGPRPAASGAERSAHLRVASRFRDAGLRTRFQRFGVPGHGRSRNVIGVHETPRSCLRIVMAHADSVPGSDGAVDNASGVGVLVSLAPRLGTIEPPCDVWLVATGAEERDYTGRPDHLGASALVRRVRRLGRSRELRIALSLDEVGRGRSFWLRSNAHRARRRVETAVLRATRASGAHARWVRDSGTGNSDHREFQLAGLPAAKLGQRDNPCRHASCDRATLLQPHTFTLVRRAVVRLARLR